MDKVSEQFLRKEIRKIMSEMSGFARVKNIMMGAVNSVKTVGIITAENPKGKQATPEYNEKNQSKLKADLKSLGLGYIQIKGKYNVLESPFVVPNITRDDVINLGLKYGQESIIYGEKEENENEVYFKWQLIFCEEGTVEKTTYSNVSNDEDLKSRDDFYSAVKGRRFIFPFYSDKKEDETPSSVYSTPKSYLGRDVVKPESQPQ
jgi:hypothetical protein